MILVVVGAGFSQNITSLVVCRFFAGLFASPGLSIGTAMVSDFLPPEKRGGPVAFFITMVQMGPVFGPIVGGMYLYAAPVHALISHCRIRHGVQGLALDAVDDTFRLGVGLRLRGLYVRVVQECHIAATSEETWAQPASGAEVFRFALLHHENHNPAGLHDVHRADRGPLRCL